MMMMEWKIDGRRTEEGSRDTDVTRKKQERQKLDEGRKLG